MQNPSVLIKLIFCWGCCSPNALHFVRENFSMYLAGLEMQNLMCKHKIYSLFFQTVILEQGLWVDIRIKIEGKHNHCLLISISINNSWRSNADSQHCICRVLNHVGRKRSNNLIFDTKPIHWGWNSLCCLKVWPLQWWFFQYSNR